MPCPFRVVVTALLVAVAIVVALLPFSKSRPRWLDAGFIDCASLNPLTRQIVYLVVVALVILLHLEIARRWISDAADFSTTSSVPTSITSLTSPS